MCFLQKKENNLNLGSFLYPGIQGCYVKKNQAVFFLTNVVFTIYVGSLDFLGPVRITTKVIFPV